MQYRKQLKRFHESGHFHELTLSCYKRKPLLTNDHWLRKLARLLESACVDEEFDLTAFVFMPEHIHLLVYPTCAAPKIGRFLARFKQPFSKWVKSVLVGHGSSLLRELTIQERPGKTCFRFWQAGGGYDRNLFEAETIEASINYIHMNPVQRGLCEKAVDWKWSSARRYLTGEKDDHLPKITFPPAELFNQGGVQTPRF